MRHLQNISYLSKDSIAKFFREFTSLSLDQRGALSNKQAAAKILATHNSCAGAVRQNISIAEQYVSIRKFNPYCRMSFYLETLYPMRQFQSLSQFSA